MRLDADERFWAKVQKTETCWLWIGSLTLNGYGQLWLHGRRVMVHRLSYTWLVGPIPEGKQLDHLCRVRNCVRPSHLEPVTNRENCMRGESFAAVNARKTHCSEGHPLVEGNLYWTGRGGRGTCKTCHKVKARRRRAMRRAA